MKVNFTQEKVTKNTIKFAEVLDDELDTAKIGSLYIRKDALKAIGWKGGATITVDIGCE